MDTYSKADMRYKYHWSPYEQHDPRVSGVPDNTPFNPEEGEEVLYLIGYLTEHLAWSVDGFGQKIESLLHVHLPQEQLSQQDVIQWIKSQWGRAIT